MVEKLTHEQPQRQAGFSLIELLVVIAILSVLSVATTMAIGRSGSDGQGDMMRFQQSFDRQRELAVHTNSIRALNVNSSGMRVVEPDDTGSKWQVSRTEIPWRGDGAIRFFGIRGAIGQPDILFLPDGRTTAFDITFSPETGRTACRTDGWGALTCDSR